MASTGPTELDDALRLIGDGMLVAIPPDYAGVAMAATRALLRRGVRNLSLVCVPQSGLQADMLIGAGAVAEIETAAVTLGEYGLAPRFTAAIRAGAIRIKDATCPAIHAGLQASEKGAPFGAMRGLIGSDLLKVRPDWRVIDNPFGPPDPGDPARRGLVPRPHGRPARQCLDRQAARTRHHGPCLGHDAGDGRTALR